VEIGVVVDLDERLHGDAEPLAIVQDGMVVIGNPPWPGIDVETRIELAFLTGTAELRIGVAAAQRPIPPADAAVIFEQLHLVAGLVQFIGRDKAGEPCSQDQDRSPLRIAVELDRAVIRRFRRMTEAGHRLVHRRPARGRTDQIEQGAPAHRHRIGFRH
jgi:hypothetical protein